MASYYADHPRLSPSGGDNNKELVPPAQIPIQTQAAAKPDEDDNLIAKQHNRSLAINRIMLASINGNKVELPTFSQK